MRSQHVNSKIMLNFRNWWFVWILQLLQKKQNFNLTNFQSTGPNPCHQLPLQEEGKSHHDKLAWTGQWWLEWYVTKCEQVGMLLNALIVNIIDTDWYRILTYVVICRLEVETSRRLSDKPATTASWPRTVTFGVPADLALGTRAINVCLF